MTENLQRSEAMARSAALEIATYRVHLNLSESTTDQKYFPVSTVVQLTVHEEISTFMDFIGESVTFLRVDEEILTPHFDGARVTLPTLSVGDHEIEVRGHALYSRTGEGLHRFVDPADGETYLYTQFEPADARRVFPNFEQPDLKASFLIGITAPASWAVISNERQVTEHPAGENSQGTPLARFGFQDTKRMSTYLTAFIAGPYTRFTDEYEGIKLGFYTRKTLAPHFDSDAVALITKQGLATFPEAFGMPYPWGKYDSIFVPEYNLGAMENPGAVTFNENAYIYRGAATRAQYAGRANTILHEMSHMWFGDLVTPKWWDDLWLKESFAEFMGAWASVEATEFTEAWSNFAGARISWAMANDQYPTTHPIVADIVDLEAADQNFDGITYAKGAAVLRQLVAFVGQEAFFAGARTYFQAHKFGNATLKDLLHELQVASNRDLSEWARQWLQSTSVSTLRAERTDAGLRLVQEGTDINGNAITRPHRFSVRSLRATDGVLSTVATEQVELTTDVVIPWEKLGGADVDAVVANSGAETYAKIALDERSLASVLATDVDDDLTRSVISTALWQMVRDARLDPREYVHFVLSQPHAQPALLSQRTTAALSVSLDLAHPHLRPGLAREMFEGAREILADLEPGTDTHTTWSRTLARAGAMMPESVDTLRTHLEESSDQDLRWGFLKALAALGVAGEAELSAELGRSGTSADKVAHLEALSLLPGSRAATLEKLLGGENSNLEAQALIDGFSHPSGADEAKAAYPDYFAHATEIWEKFSQEIAERILYGLYPATDRGEGEGLTPAQEWLAQNESAPGALRKLILDEADDHARKLRIQEAFN
ncbi:aminopeptidase N [Arcanobacterium wilhelmae]|uniref:Aminopeptidase N n=1 Tax=Arcanobacterium wilhelmae TaxID=1803177 RepID=A0ABT9N915_9ACTO|nr:aminopeptidase N [Arcanobacterium wilhelmae]MDP9800010.1 aminopeptidase N [Arcanobacterium wilhelmae]WFN89508.1 aminopeptidase N [Arcanobacterium wilhelmae]